MANRNTKCFNCKNMFHTCSACGLVNAEYDYCSKKCWEMAGSPVYKDEIGEILDGFPFLMVGMHSKILKSYPLKKLT